MNTDNLYARRLRRLKWGVIGLAALFLLLVEAFYYVRGVPLVDDVIDWIIGMAGAILLIEFTFWLGGNLQRRLRREIAERRRAEESLRQAHGELERRVQERTAELTRANEALQAEIVERRRMEGVLEHRAAQLTLINQIGRRVAAELDADEVLRTAAALIQESFDCAGEMVTLSVNDDGQGFDRQAVLSVPSQGAGLGLVGMQERIELLGGWLEIASQPGQGARLTAHVPWQEGR